jgi:hypothetical protein
MSMRSKLEALQRDLEQKQVQLDADFDQVARAIDALDDETVVPGMSDKATDQRYARQSVNWGVIAVHPTDLYAVYKGLSTKRLGAIAVNEGGRSTRTTAVAFLIGARQALVSNGYSPAEAAVIASSVIANGA